MVDGLLATLEAAGAVLVDVGAGGGVTVRGTHPAVTVTDLSAPDAPDTDLGAISGEPDVLVALNLALAPAPVVVDIARSAGGGVPTVVVVHRSGPDATATFPRLLVRVAADADAAVAEVVAGPDVDALVVPVTELDVADAGRLGFLHVQLLGRRAWQIGLQASRVGRDATLTSAAVSLGGDYARLRTDSALAGAGGTSNLLAAWFADGTQVHDLRTVQHHQAPQATSDLYFKGAVANRSRSVYTGLIRVEKGARGTNAFQTNRNLVLHSGAHAESVPNLEIEDNDVRCSHASAVGPIEADQRFYLEARGVPTDVAERLIALGFVDEVLRRLPVPAAVAPLRLAIAAKLDEAEALERDLTGVGA
ncbi:MAG TPA: SufD family Fe-S cluster assembly protein [Acidimicrobiales bacterium]|nr:SufD family Fe-S cluster assembly protein [Acidimicrobiales bacterium]